VVNPITTIIRGNVGVIADPQLDRLKQLVIDECIAVANAEGVRLEEDLLTQVNAAYAGSKNFISSKQDRVQHRLHEIRFLNRAVVTVGARHGLPCPINDGLTKIIKGMEACARGQAP